MPFRETPSLGADLGCTHHVLTSDEVLSRIRIEIVGSLDDLTRFDKFLLLPFFVGFELLLVEETAHAACLHNIDPFTVRPLNVPLEVLPLHMASLFWNIDVAVIPTFLLHLRHGRHCALGFSCSAKLRPRKRRGALGNAIDELGSTMIPR